MRCTCGAHAYTPAPTHDHSPASPASQFVMQQQCHKLRIKQSQLKAERSELKYQRWQQFAEMQRMQAEKQRAVAMAQVEHKDWRCTHDALATHLPRTHDALTMHLPCTCHALAMHLPCTCHALTVQCSLGAGRAS